MTLAESVLVALTIRPPWFVVVVPPIEETLSVPPAISEAVRRA